MGKDLRWFLVQFLAQNRVSYGIRPNHSQLYLARCWKPSECTSSLKTTYYTAWYMETIFFLVSSGNLSDFQLMPVVTCLSTMRNWEDPGISALRSPWWPPHMCWWAPIRSSWSHFCRLSKPHFSSLYYWGKCSSPLHCLAVLCWKLAPFYWSLSGTGWIKTRCTI